MKLPFEINLKDKVVVITGAGGVLCSMFAKAMAKTGAKVALLDLNEEMAPNVMLDIIHANMNIMEPKDEKEAYLLTLVENYKPLEEHNEQTKELFRWGATEENLWQVQIP